MNDPWKASTDEKLEKEAPQRIPKQVQDFLRPIAGKKWLSGGKRATWEEIKKLTKEWSKESKQYFGTKIPNKVERKPSFKGTLQKYKKNNLTLATDSRYYQKIFPDIGSFRIIPEELARTSEKNLAARLVQITIAARTHEINNKSNGPVKYEYEILEKGGLILGFDTQKVLVYYPFSAEIMIKKLKKKRL